MAEFKRLPGSVVGGDVVELRTFAQHLTDRALPEIEHVFHLIDQRIEATTWSGPDATAFALDWAQQRTQMLTHLRSFLEAASQKASSQARAQESASGL